MNISHEKLKELLYNAYKEGFISSNKSFNGEGIFNKCDKRSFEIRKSVDTHFEIFHLLTTKKTYGKK